MSTKLKALALAVVVLSVGELFGHAVNVWRQGGEGGTVNLPAARSRLMSPGGVKAAYRYGFRMANAGNGLSLNLPSNLPAAVATFTYGSLRVSTAVYGGKVRIQGSELVKLQKVGVKSFHIDLDDGFDCYMNLLVVLTEGGQPTCQVLVK